MRNLEKNCLYYTGDSVIIGTCSLKRFFIAVSMYLAISQPLVATIKQTKYTLKLLKRNSAHIKMQRVTNYSVCTC